MKNKKKISIPVIIVAIIVGVAAIVVFNNIAEKNKLETLRQEYTAELEERMAGVYDDKDCIEYQLSDISYTVTNIEKAGDHTYTVSVVVDCTSTDPELWSATKSLLAYAVEDYVPGGYNDKFKASTGDTVTLRNENYKDSYFGESMLTVNVNGEHVDGPEAHDYSSSSSKDTVKCKSCGREFKKGSDNARSISRTNMCTNCYNNYQSMSDYLNEQPVK